MLLCYIICSSPNTFSRNCRVIPVGWKLSSWRECRINVLSNIWYAQYGIFSRSQHSLNVRFSFSEQGICNMQVIGEFPTVSSWILAMSGVNKIFCSLLFRVFWSSLYHLTNCRRMLAMRPALLTRWRLKRACFTSSTVGVLQIDLLTQVGGELYRSALLLTSNVILSLL